MICTDLRKSQNWPPFHHHLDRQRVFNLGYFTWVEQQGISIEDFVARREPEFWKRLLDLVPAWDAMITEFNSHLGLD